MISSPHLLPPARMHGGRAARPSDLPGHRPLLGSAAGVDEFTAHYHGLDPIDLISAHCSSSSSSSSRASLPAMLLQDAAPDQSSLSPTRSQTSHLNRVSHTSDSHSRAAHTPSQNPDSRPGDYNHSSPSFLPRHLRPNGLSTSSTSITSCSTTSTRTFPDVFRGPLNESFSSCPSTSCSTSSTSFPILLPKQKNEMVFQFAGSPHRVPPVGAASQIHLASQVGSQMNGGDLESLQYIVSRIQSLVIRLRSEHIEMRRSALKELRLLAKHDDERRAVIFEAGAVGPLLDLMDPDTCDQDPISQQEATTTLLNLSVNQRIRGRMGKALEPLVRVISQGSSLTAMENAAVALVNLVGRDEGVKARVGSMGAIPPLIELLNNGTERGKKDAATTLYALSSTEENKRRMVRGGATRLLLEFISEEGSRAGMVEKAMAILRNLVSLEEGRVAFVEEGGAKCLLGVIHESYCSKKSQELALLILFQLCRHSSKHRTMILKMDPLPALSALFDSTATNARLKLQIYEVIQFLEEHRVSLMKQLDNHKGRRSTPQEVYNV